jgi:hypothetical protein
MINANTINNWITSYDIENKAIAYYWEYITSYMENIDDEYSNILKSIDLCFMKVKLYKVSLSTSIEFQKDFMDVYLDITFSDRKVGTFQIIYTLLGEYTEEYLKFDDVNYLWRLGAVYENILEIGRKALKEGATEDFVTKITDLSIDYFKD